MAKLARKKGTTSQIFHVFIQDSASTVGAGKTGLAFNTAGLACRYITSAGTLSAAITLEDITTLGTYAAPTSNAHMRIKEVSNADPSKGLYEIQVHNDWMILSGGNLIVMLSGAAGMAPVMLEIDLQADVNVTNINGDGQSLADLKHFADTGYDPATSKVEGVKLVTTTTTNTDMRGTDNAATAANLATLTAYVDTEVQAILDIVGHATYGNSAIRTRGDAAWLTAAGFSTHSVANIWDEVVEGGLTARQLVRVMASALAGKASGGGTTTVTFTGVDGVTTRITATVDANGNRSAVTVNGA
ncbi:MAG: hypothetical protein AABY51_10070 [Deltaproteobacteria bacterium]